MVSMLIQQTVRSRLAAVGSDRIAEAVVKSFGKLRIVNLGNFGSIKIFVFGFNRVDGLVSLLRQRLTFGLAYFVLSSLIEHVPVLFVDFFNLEQNQDFLKKQILEIRPYLGRNS